MAKPEIHLYTLCWNDERMIPFFIKHYGPVVDRFFIYDNGSTDRSLSLLKGDERIIIRHFDVLGQSFVEEELRLSETIWRESRDAARWIIMVDLDEHLFHADLASYLDRCWSDGVTVIDTEAYEMVSNLFPPPDQLLCASTTAGFRDPAYDKLCVFDPKAILRTGYTPGRHRANPQGRVIYPAERELKLLHYKNLGFEYLVSRSAQLATGLGPGDIALNFGAQYLLPELELRAKFVNQRRASAPVPGLAGSGLDAPRLKIDAEFLEPILQGDNRYTFILPRAVGRFAVCTAGDVLVARLRLSSGTHAVDLALDDYGLEHGWRETVQVGSIVARRMDTVATVELCPDLQDLPQVDIELIWLA